MRPVACVELVCKTCGGVFYLKPGRLRERRKSPRGKYCSSSCRAQRKPFWDYVLKTDSCWLWQGNLNHSGYGLYKLKRAHRVAYELTYGPIEAGKVLCHKCDNPPCVRPDHLFPGTHKDNMHDALRKGRPVGCRAKEKRSMS